jgi:methionyl-tRNA synthetase
MDKYIQDTEPFKLVKEDLGAAKIIIESLVQDLYDVAVMLKPILPETSEKILLSINENKKPEVGVFDRK